MPANLDNAVSGASGPFRGGRNVAMKIPRAQFDKVLDFYRSILELPTTWHQGGGWVVSFGHFELWLDPVESGEPEIWLEVVVDDVVRAEELLAERGVGRETNVEPLPPDYKGFWIRNAARCVHLVSEVGY